MNIKMNQKSDLKPLLHLFLGCVLSVMVGCSTYNQREESTATSWKSSQTQASETAARKRMTETQHKPDEVIAKLECATVLRTCGKHEESNKIFDEAETSMQAFEKQAKTQISEEVWSLITNPERSDYRGYYYDKIMVNTYKALNFLNQGKIDDARIELNRAVQHQADAVDMAKKRIAAEQAKNEKAKEEDALNKANSDSKFKSEYSYLDSLKPYGAYENPFTVYLDGLFFMANPTAVSDLERARKSFERVSVFSPDNSYVKEDLEAVNSLSSGKAIPPTTYVILETGSAPVRREIKFVLPTFTGSTVPVVYPKQEFDADHVPSLTVNASGTNQLTTSVASMDSVIGLEFKSELSRMVWQATSGAVAKGAANIAAQQGGGIASLATQLYNNAVAHADLRTWLTLPKEFQVCRIPTPSDRKLEISCPGGQKSSVVLNDGYFNVVYVRAIGARSELQISQFKLK